MSECTEACYATQECTVCKKRKKPTGRSAPIEFYRVLCDPDCPGYYADPKPGHLWPEERPKPEEEEEEP